MRKSLKCKKPVKKSVKRGLGKMSMKRVTSNNKIDFVVLWVDPNDKKWQESRKKARKQFSFNDSIDDKEARYRDWGLFKYWFRSVEKYAPWVNKVYLVTCGHVPEWLNLKSPKLEVIKHSDIMPEDALPTFNSNAIELCVHNIPNLSEQFVLFNDDMFLIKPVKPSDFFKNGKPKNTMSLFSLMASCNGQKFYKVVANNITIINKHFSFAASRRKNLLKYLSLKQRQWILFTYPLLIYNQFVGFRDFHIPISYLKQTFNTVWKEEEELLKCTVYSKFRDNERNVSHWLFNYWQFASGEFEQRNANFGTSVKVDNPGIDKVFRRRGLRTICINDTDLSDVEFDRLKIMLANQFEVILPEKCSFEV